MSDSARQYYDTVFKRRYRSILEDARRTPLAVLIWGPGVNGGDLYTKRLQIRDALRMKDIAAVFPEEVGDSGASECPSLKFIEMMQAFAADFIVVIQASAGSIAEVHDTGALID